MGLSLSVESAKNENQNLLVSNATSQWAVNNASSSRGIVNLGSNAGGQPGATDPAVTSPDQPHNSISAKNTGV